MLRGVAIVVPFGEGGARWAIIQYKGRSEIVWIGLENSELRPWLSDSLLYVF